MTSKATAPAADPAVDAPSFYDPVDYKNRNVIERCFCRLKQWRGLATRYDKLAITYEPPSS